MASIFDRLREDPGTDTESTLDKVLQRIRETKAENERAARAEAEAREQQRLANQAEQDRISSWRDSLDTLPWGGSTWSGTDDEEEDKDEKKSIVEKLTDVSPWKAEPRDAGQGSEDISADLAPTRVRPTPTTDLRSTDLAPTLVSKPNIAAWKPDVPDWRTMDLGGDIGYQVGQRPDTGTPGVGRSPLISDTPAGWRPDSGGTLGSGIGIQQPGEFLPQGDTLRPGGDLLERLSNFGTRVLNQGDKAAGALGRATVGTLGQTDEFIKKDIEGTLGYISYFSPVLDYLGELWNQKFAPENAEFTTETGVRAQISWERLLHSLNEFEKSKVKQLTDLIGVDSWAISTMPIAGFALAATYGVMIALPAAADVTSAITGELTGLGSADWTQPILNLTNLFTAEDVDYSNLEGMSLNTAYSVAVTAFSSMMAQGMKDAGFAVDPNSDKESPEVFYNLIYPGGEGRIPNSIFAQNTAGAAFQGAYKAVMQNPQSWAAYWAQALNEHEAAFMLNPADLEGLTPEQVETAYSLQSIVTPWGPEKTQVVVQDWLDNQNMINYATQKAKEAYDMAEAATTPAEQERYLIQAGMWTAKAKKAESTGLMTIYDRHWSARGLILEWAGDPTGLLLLPAQRIVKALPALADLVKNIPILGKAAKVTATAAQYTPLIGLSTKERRAVNVLAGGDWKADAAKALKNIADIADAGDQAVHTNRIRNWIAGFWELGRSKARAEAYLNSSFARVLLGEAETVADAKALLKAWMTDGGKSLIEGVDAAEFTGRSLKGRAVNGKVYNLGTSHLSVPEVAAAQTSIEGKTEILALLNSLKGAPDDPVNKPHLMAELMEVFVRGSAGKFKVSGVLDAPINTERFLVVPLQDGYAEIQFLAGKGKKTQVLGKTKPMSLAEANKLRKSAQGNLEKGKEVTRNVASALTDQMRAVTTNLVMDMGLRSVSNNAIGGNLAAMLHDVFTWQTIDAMEAWYARKLGVGVPGQRWGDLKGAGEQGFDTVGKAAKKKAKVGGVQEEFLGGGSPLSNKWPFKQIKELRSGMAARGPVRIGEGSVSLGIHYSAAKDFFEKNWTKIGKQQLTQLLTDMGITDPALARQYANDLVQIGIDGDAGKLAEAFIGIAEGKPPITIGRFEPTYAQVLGPTATKKIDDLLATMTEANVEDVKRQVDIILDEALDGLSRGAFDQFDPSRRTLYTQMEREELVKEWMRQEAMARGISTSDPGLIAEAKRMRNDMDATDKQLLTLIRMNQGNPDASGWVMQAWHELQIARIEYEKEAQALYADAASVLAGDNLLRKQHVPVSDPMWKTGQVPMPKDPTAQDMGDVLNAQKGATGGGRLPGGPRPFRVGQGVPGPGDVPGAKTAEDMGDVLNAQRGADARRRAEEAGQVLSDQQRAFGQGPTTPQRTAQLGPYEEIPGEKIRPGTVDAAGVWETHANEAASLVEKHKTVRNEIISRARAAIKNREPVPPVSMQASTEALLDSMRIDPDQELEAMRALKGSDQKKFELRQAHGRDALEGERARMTAVWRNNPTEDATDHMISAEYDIGTYMRTTKRRVENYKREQLEPALAAAGNNEWAIAKAWADFRKYSDGQWNQAWSYGVRRMRAAGLEMVRPNATVAAHAGELYKDSKGRAIKIHGESLTEKGMWRVQYEDGTVTYLPTDAVDPESLKNYEKVREKVEEEVVKAYKALIPSAIGAGKKTDMEKVLDAGRDERFKDIWDQIKVEANILLQSPYASRHVAGDELDWTRHVIEGFRGQFRRRARELAVEKATTQATTGSLDAVRKFNEEILPLYDNLLGKAMRFGDEMVSATTLDYMHEYAADALMALRYPYAYFFTRQGKNVLELMMFQPRKFAAISDFYTVMGIENRASQQPARNEGTYPGIRIGDTEIRFRDLLQNTLLYLPKFLSNGWWSPGQANYDEEAATERMLEAGLSDAKAARFGGWLGAWTAFRELESKTGLGRYPYYDWAHDVARHVMTGQPMETAVGTLNTSLSALAFGYAATQGSHVPYVTPHYTPYLYERQAMINADKGMYDELGGAMYARAINAYFRQMATGQPVPDQVKSIFPGAEAEAFRIARQVNSQYMMRSIWNTLMPLSVAPVSDYEISLAEQRQTRRDAGTFDPAQGQYGGQTAKNAVAAEPPGEDVLGPELANDPWVMSQFNPVADIPKGESLQADWQNPGEAAVNDWVKVETRKLQAQAQAAGNRAVTKLLEENPGATSDELREARQAAQDPFQTKIEDMKLQRIPTEYEPGAYDPTIYRNPVENRKAWTDDMYWRAVDVDEERFGPRPEWSDDFTRSQRAQYTADLKEYMRKKEDAFVSWITDPEPLKDQESLRVRGGHWRMSEQEARNYWRERQAEYRMNQWLPVERMIHEQDDRRKTPMWEQSTLQNYKDAESRIPGSTEILDKYADMDDAQRQAFKDEDPTVRAVMMAAYSPDVYDDLEAKFGKGAVERLYEANATKPEWPGENATDEQKNAYYQARNAWLADGNEDYAEMNFWLYGRTDWRAGDFMSTPVDMAYNAGVDYEKVMDVLDDESQSRTGMGIWELERALNEARATGGKEGASAFYNQYPDADVLLAAFDTMRYHLSEVPEDLGPGDLEQFMPQQLSYSQRTTRTEPGEETKGEKSIVEFMRGLATTDEAVGTVSAMPGAEPFTITPDEDFAPTRVTPKMEGEGPLTQAVNEQAAAKAAGTGGLGDIFDRARAGITPSEGGPVVRGPQELPDILPDDIYQLALMDSDFAYWEGKRKEWAARSAAVEAEFGAEVRGLYDSYLALPKGEARAEYKAQHPELRVVSVYTWQPVTYAKWVQEFGQETLMTWARAPRWEDNEQAQAARSDYWKAHPDAFVAGAWLNGRPEPREDEVTDDQDWTYNAGADYELAKEKFGDNIWDIVRQQKTLPDDKKARAQWYEANPSYSAWADWWYAALPDTRKTYESTGYQRYTGRYYGGGGGGGGRRFSSYGGGYNDEVQMTRARRPEIQAWRADRQDSWSDYIQRVGPDRLRRWIE